MGKEIINEDNIIRVTPERKLPFKKGIGEIIFEKLTQNKDAPLQIDGVTGEVDTYGSILQRCIRTALKMRSKGLTRDNVVTVCSYNHLNTNIPIIASLLLGVKTTSLDPALSLSDTSHLLQIIHPRMIFVSPNGIKVIEDAIQKIGLTTEIVVFGKSDKYTDFSEYLGTSSEEERKFAPVEIKDLKQTASIFFSSGTTGLAKGVCLSHLSLIGAFSPLTKTDNRSSFTTLNYSSPYWVSSLLMLLNTIAGNGCRLVLPDFEIDSFWNTLQKYEITMLILSPTQLATVCNSTKPENILSPKVIFAGGSIIHKEQLNKMKELFQNTIVGSGYGQTELGGGCLQFNITTEEIKFLFQKPTSCGRPTPGYTYKIVDLETEQPLGPNQQGELRVKTEFCMTGYYNMDSSDSWDSEGFLKTGDIAYYDDDYCFYIVDRLKEMLKFQGWQITPAKLESILLSHPAVETALVIGLPHPVDCDHPMGIVKLKNSTAGVTIEEIQKYYDEKIDDDKYKLRGGLKIVNDIPVTPTGKYKKMHLRKLILAGSL